MVSSLLRSLVVLVTVALCGCTEGGFSLRSGQPGLNVGEEALRAGSPQIALQVANGILAQNPADVSALLVQGDALTLLGRPNEANTSFENALHFDPSSVRGKIGLGRLRLATDPAAAETLFLDALDHQPRNITAWNDLGIARDLLGRHDAAQEAYRKALGISPEMTAAQVNLALSLAMSGDTDGAQKLIQPLASDPGASRKLRHDYAAVLAMAGNNAEAERILSGDLSPAEVREALEAYRKGRTDAASQPIALTASAGMSVQLGAFPSEDAAKAAWQRLRERLPDLLAGHHPITAKTLRDSKVTWRLSTDGLSDAAAARDFCGKVLAVQGTCVTGGG